METVLKPFWWKFGRPADIWLKNIELIEKVIRAEKLRPLDREHVAYMVPSQAAPTKAPVPFKNPEIFGGIRMAHLHFKNDIYLLDDRQWRDFSTAVVKAFQEKLSAAKSVGFEQALELSESINSLG